jgi:D-alanyl-D-alanine carboxypeptidase
VTSRLRRRRSARTLAIAAGVALAVMAAGAPSASGHVPPPTVTALHAFIGDPLWGLDTSEGTLFAIKPDERTAMASTTKLMTLDVTVHAIDAGVVSPNDQVVVDPFAASIEPNNSVMADINGVTLEPGEVVRLDDLIRGMMYPSGNDAAWAIAYHVAQAYGDDVNGDGTVDGCDTVEMMNQHAVAIGLADTHFTSANGWDDPGTTSPPTCAPDVATHYTTARELAEIVEHGLEGNSYFQQVIGFVGTWTATTQGPSGPKTYVFNFPFFGPPPTFGPPPSGWEGGKGGGTLNCNGPNNGCMGASDRRIGRRVVLAFMQGQPWSEEPGMFAYGFAQIFHPDPRGSSSSVGPAELHDTFCSSSSRCVSAVLPVNGDVKLVSWHPDLDASAIGVLDQEGLPGSALPPKTGNGKGPAGDVAVTQLSSGPIVLANRKGSSVELSRWSMDGGGALTLLDSDIKAGPARTMDLQPVNGTAFLSAFIDPDGALVVKSWKLDGSSFVKLDTYRDESRDYSEVSIAGPLKTDVYNGHRAVTASIAPGLLVHDVWGVDPVTGAISRLGELVAPGNRDGVEITPFAVHTNANELVPPSYYATAFRSIGGYALFFYRIDADGTPINEGAISAIGPVEAVDAAPLGVGGVMAASRAATGGVELRAWEARRNADDTITPAQISQHTAQEPASSLDLVDVPTTHAEGDYVTAATDPGTGELRLRAYRSGDRPY